MQYNVIKAACFFVKMSFFEDVRYFFAIKSVTVVLFNKWFHNLNGFFFL